MIGAAEGNKEMADRHQGFGAYDVPFLGPMRTGIRGRQDDAADEEVRHYSFKLHFEEASHYSDPLLWGLTPTNPYSKLLCKCCAVAENTSQGLMLQGLLHHSLTQPG